MRRFFSKDSIQLPGEAGLFHHPRWLGCACALCVCVRLLPHLTGVFGYCFEPRRVEPTERS